MLNKDGQRELAYVVRIDKVEPIEGYDRVELAHVGGWTVVVGKGEFHDGDPAIYFEIDSKLPEVKPFTDMEFLTKKKFKIKTQKMCKRYSQGLLMSARNFEWTVTPDRDGVVDDAGVLHRITDDSKFLTEKLGVIYAVPEDNKRKAKSVDKYQRLAQRMGKKFSKQPFKWLMRRMWGKKLLFFIYGKKIDKPRDWPPEISKTDEERVENMPWVFSDKNLWIATEKIDGTSTTFFMRRGKIKNEFLVCSRNVVFNAPDKQCFYDSNVYLEMAEKYKIEEKLAWMLKCNISWNWVAIQGETYGAGIQKRDYSLNEHRFAAFNLIDSVNGRWNTARMAGYLESQGIPCVPILDEYYVLPDSIDELRDYVDGAPSKIDGNIKEGIVFRSKDGTRSFKCVSPKYLMKYHG